MGIVKFIAGHTGFVGSNIASKHRFDGYFNSKNIGNALGTKPDLLVFCGVPAEMFLADNNPAADLAVIENAAENIRKIAPKRLVLVSSIAVMDNVNGTDEDCVIDTSKLTAYGLHRYKLEQMAQKIVPDCLVVRLPALFGKGLKKNFIYDLMHYFPAMLNKAKFDAFLAKESIIAECYKLQDNGFYKLNISDEQKNALRSAFERLNFSALNFTDSRSMFQFYNLAHLWEHIEIALTNDMPRLHLAVEPLSAANVYRGITGGEFTNEVSAKPFNYDFRTKHSALFGGGGGYIFGREKVLSDLKAFVGENG
jgi:hypothetical protein